MRTSPNVTSDRAATNAASVNQSNAQKSTGPRTAAGKQRSSLNALRHGLTGHVVVLPTEDLTAYQRHLQRFVDQFQPKGALEGQLVQSLGDTTWRLNRVPATEATFLTLAAENQLDSIHTNEPRAASALALAQAFHQQSQALANISIYEQRLARLFDRTLKQLREIQAERREQERRQMNDAAEILEMHQERALPYDPAQDGFVFSTAEIQTFIQRRDRLDEAYSEPEDRLAAAS
ncbi:MAG TPA: hypothetical protein VNX70_00990 [Bryobacteraceae bacterium]|jgi:hypothetical protein|nr:hypothetical protein [Bryobacteraceae bacterium]